MEAGKKSKGHKNDKNYEDIEIYPLRKNKKVSNPCARRSNLDALYTSSLQFIYVRHNTGV